MGAITGIWGHPFLDVAPLLDLSCLPALHDEICLALTTLPCTYTGGSHKTMGIVPPSLRDDPYRDYGQVLSTLPKEELFVLASLADDEGEFDPERDDPRELGEERNVPLSHRQMLYLEMRHGVYFPWKVYFELIPNRYWSEKHVAAGKDFCEEARLHLPQTVAFVRSLPFESIGSCKLLGLEANDHGTIHRDGDPRTKPTVDHFITFCPAGDKRLFVCDESVSERHYGPSRAYWFNDSDYHGVEADPFFRYSIRVDGTFRADFMNDLKRRYLPGFSC